jgi:hypothetical protein
LFTNLNSAQPENPGLGKALAVCYLDYPVAISLALNYLAGDVHVMRYYTYPPTNLD